MPTEACQPKPGAEHIVNSTIFSYFEDLSNLADSELDVIRNMDEDIDGIRQMGDILKLHPITKQIYTENNFGEVQIFKF